jgi:hypothetical protein
MMTTELSQLDDYLVHQTPDPVRFVASSDRNFYDRHYFCMHGSDDRLFFIFGFGQYPNLGVQDAFALLRMGDKQYVVRSSSELGDRGLATCGPFRVEVLEGLKRLRLTLGPNDLGIEADLTFEGAHPAVAEPRQTQRSFGRLLQDLTRYGQNGDYCGKLVTPNRTFEISGPQWRGYRDRSWGIRPVGEPEPKGIQKGIQSGYPSNWAWLYFCCQFDDFSLMIKCRELDTGERTMEEAVRIWNDPARGSEQLGRFEHDLVMSPDGQFIQGGVLTCPNAPGGPMTVEIEQILPAYLMRATGYNQNDPEGWSHGAYQGKLKTETRTIDLSGPGPHGPSNIDAVGRYKTGGQVGYGLYEYLFVGGFPKYGIRGSGIWNGPKVPAERQ